MTTHWTDEQLRIILLTVAVADGRCPHCVAGCVEEFINLTDKSIMLDFHRIAKTIDPDVLDWEEVKAIYYED